MGLFISIEGNDGSGKTTIVHLLEQELKKRAIPVITSREPGGIRISEEIRKIILNPDYSEMSASTEALLYAASRSQHVDEKIIPALKEGKIVICDRFLDSSLAYQGYARDLGIDEIYQLNLFAIKNYLPDLTIFLDIDNETAKQRVLGRMELDRLELETDNFHLQVKRGYEIICDRYPNRIVKVDANRELEQVLNTVLELVLNKYEQTINAKNND